MENVYTDTLWQITTDTLGDSDHPVTASDVQDIMEMFEAAGALRMEGYTWQVRETTTELQIIWQRVDDMIEPVRGANFVQIDDSTWVQTIGEVYEEE